MFGQKRTHENTASGSYLRAEVPQTSPLSAGPWPLPRGRGLSSRLRCNMEALRHVASCAPIITFSVSSVSRTERIALRAMSVLVCFPLFPNAESPIPEMSCCQGDSLEKLNGREGCLSVRVCKCAHLSVCVHVCAHLCCLCTCVCVSVGEYMCDQSHSVRSLERQVKGTTGPLSEL